jgi:hypothetical protein
MTQKLAMDLKVCPWCGGPTYERAVGDGDSVSTKTPIAFECINIDCPVQPAIVTTDREHGKALWNTRNGEE